jgi:hypothetical protein
VQKRLHKGQPYCSDSRRMILLQYFTDHDLALKNLMPALILFEFIVGVIIINKVTCKFSNSVSG